MMTKLWAMAWKEVYRTFTDRNLILIMIATPLLISSIVGLAFGGLGGGDVPIENIPVAIINRDAGSSFGANYGQIFESAFISSAAGSDSQSSAPACDLTTETSSDSGFSMSLDTLTDAVVFDAVLAQSLVADGAITAPEGDAGSAAYIEAAARAAVDNGTYTALLIIPEDFSQKMSYIPVLHPQIEATGVTIYANSGRAVAAEIIRSIVTGITNQVETGNIAIAATFGQITDDYGLATMGQAAGSMDFGSAFACAFDPAFTTITIDSQSVSGTSTNAAGGILVQVGASQAMFFALFTAQFGVLGMYDERRNWTLQRLITTPTPRWVILGGKLIGVFITVLFQLLMLMIALTVVGSLIQGELALIWGSNFFLIALVLLAASLAVSGLGMLLAGLARTPEQAQTFGPVVNIALAVLGGAFGFQLPQAIAGFSLIYWGQNAFTQLAAGQSDILLNLVVLVIQGAVMFLVGLLLFNRGFEAL
ncbi:MAG: ABC transporter permease [Anaerolineaceae bacterium]|nr:ABC transporter permease [Anaerolineaceae bacterium]